MTARTGLFTAPVPGTPPVGTSATDGRLVLAALFGTQGRCIAGGVLTPSSTTMNIGVGASVWSIPDVTNAAAVFLSPTDAGTVTPAAGPATGSRIDVLAVKQANFENGDADSRAVATLFPGIASGSPSAPSVPAGYWVYSTITVPANASTATACTITLTNPASVSPLGITGEFASAAGTFNNATAVSAGASTSSTITFPAGRFTQPPIVTPSASNGRFTVVSNTITTTGATLQITNVSAGAGTPGSMSWTAVQMTPASAAG